MTPLESVAISDDRYFSFVSGLWKGDKEPLIRAAVLRSTNFRGDGFLNYDDIAELDVREDQLKKRKLIQGDIIIERSGGGPKQPVGRVGLFDPPDDREFATSNFTTALRVEDRGSFDPEFVCFFLHAIYLSGATEALQRATTGIRNLDWAEYKSFELPKLPLQNQKLIASFLRKTHKCLDLEHLQLNAMNDLKRAAMKRLFTNGLRGEAQKETEIGLMPESWIAERLDRHAKVVSTRMSYSELETMAPANDGELVKVLGIKVADMNVPGNEVELLAAGLEKHVPRAIAEYRCAPPRTIIFPKRGAAIATNKKRIANEWTVFDPNVIGVISGNDLDQKFLFHWFQTFDLRTITEPGPTPQLNKKNLDPLIIPVPPTLDEQREIASILDAIDRKIDLHRRKCAVLDELFKALLHKLMTGQLRVADLDLDALTPKTTGEVAP